MTDMFMTCLINSYIYSNLNDFIEMYMDHMPGDFKQKVMNFTGARKNMMLKEHFKTLVQTKQLMRTQTCIDETHSADTIPNKANTIDNLDIKWNRGHIIEIIGTKNCDVDVNIFNHVSTYIENTEIFDYPL